MPGPHADANLRRQEAHGLLEGRRFAGLLDEPEDIARGPTREAMVRALLAAVADVDIEGGVVVFVERTQGLRLSLVGVAEALEARGVESPIVDPFEDSLLEFLCGQGCDPCAGGSGAEGVARPRPPHRPAKPFSISLNEYPLRQARKRSASRQR